MTALEVALNDELSNVFGAQHNWLTLIKAGVGRRATTYVKSRNGLIDDVVTDVISAIIIDVRDGNLGKAVIRCKEMSKTEDELVDSIKHVLMKAVYFRTSDIMRQRAKLSSTQFSQMSSKRSEDAPDFSDKIVARPEVESEFDTPDYVKLMIDELELMALAEEDRARGQYKHNVIRLRFAQEVAKDRASGMPLAELCEKHKLQRGSKMSAIFHDIERAFLQVAQNSKDPTLIRGITRRETVEV